MRRRTLPALLAAALALFATLTAAPALATPTAVAPAPVSAVRADATSLTIDSFTSDFHLSRDDDGTALLRTVETIVASFPSHDANHGIERSIPLLYDDVHLETDVVSVTDDGGRELDFSREDRYGSANLRIGDPDSYVHGLHTYVITYTQRNVVREFADTNADEFYWDVNGTDWGLPFGVVEARVHLGEGLAAELTGQQACYAGAYGANDRPCTIERSGDVVTAKALDLGSRENLTIAIGFDRSTFAAAPTAGEHWLFTIAPWLLYGGMVAAMLWMLAVRYLVWRDAPGRGTIVPQYAPPKGMYPALAAELMKKQGVGFAAEIVNFAVNRVVRLRVFPDDPPSKRYELEVLSEDTGRLLEPEVTLLRAIVGKPEVRSVRRLDTNDRKLGDRLAKLAGREKDAVRSLGLRARPSGLPATPVAAFSLLIVVLSIIVATIAAQRYVESALVGPLPYAAIAAFVGVIIAAIPRPVLTEEGVEVRDHLLGMRDYLELAEADRIRVLQAPDTAERVDVTDRSAVLKLYERLLPYAMVLGVDRQWAAELEREYETTDAPDWYAGNDGTRLSSIAALSSVSTRDFTTTPTPSSSSSSSGRGSSGGGSRSGGSSGGGSSGGGGGGGGGGGW